MKASPTSVAPNTPPGSSRWRSPSAPPGPGIIWARAMEVIGTLIDAVAVVDQVFAHIPHERGRPTDPMVPSLRKYSTNCPRLRGCAAIEVCCAIAARPLMQ